MKTTLLKALFCSAGLFFSLQAKLQIITTVAGNGTGGYSGDGGLAINAPLSPDDVKFDATGNLYIADLPKGVVRKVDVSTGIITTVAGTGIQGFSGDGGLAVQAKCSPMCIAVDSSGNIYLSEFYFRIRKVDAITGIITTIAGGGSDLSDGIPAVNASISLPAGVAVDASGKSLYIADQGSNRIRKVNLLTGIITTAAGNGTKGYNGEGILAINAQLDGPYAIAIDSTTNIYFSDIGNYRIRKVNAPDGIITTVAGNGIKGHTGDEGSAVNAEIGYSMGLALDKDNIYMGDFDFFYVRKINLTNNIITTVAGSGQSEYNGDGIIATDANFTTSGIATDAEGNIYIADLNNHRVRKVTTGTLPLQLLSFTAQRNDKTNLLKWSTVNEINTDRFEIQRSNDSRMFSIIGAVRSLSNGKLKNDYVFADAQPLQGANYYRLKMIDKDGKFVYSAIKSVNNISSLDVKLYPNPVKNVITIEGLQGRSNISIIGLQGSVLAKATTTNSSYTWNIKQLPAGTYYVRIEADKNATTLKVIKE